MPFYISFYFTISFIYPFLCDEELSLKRANVITQFHFQHKTLRITSSPGDI